MQNYQQVVGQLGGTSGSKLITPEEAVVLIDDLEATAPSVHQHYTDEIALAVRSALTDAELFISYNMPAKALGPLVGALPLAPSDLRLNQRLAALAHARRPFRRSCLCCRTLQSVYSEADHPEEATRYGELAERYEERVLGSRPCSLLPKRSTFSSMPPRMFRSINRHLIDSVSRARTERSPEFSVEEVAGEESRLKKFGRPSHSRGRSRFGLAHCRPKSAEPEFAVVDESAAAADEPAATGEIDLSSEWDDSITD